jgi:histidine triad (HIT) family protein
MSSLFTKIINREIPAYIVAENDHYIAFLDIIPVAKGHTLVVPKIEVDYIFDLDDDTFKGLMLFAKQVAKALKQAIPCKRIGVSVIGLEVPHTHVHLLPLNSMSDANFSKARDRATDAELQSVAAAIKAQFERL